MKNGLKHISTFGKFSISLPIALSCYAGYTMAAGELTFHGLMASLGIFLMSAGASALNQWQEQQADARMERTQNRPLPQNRFSQQYAIGIIAFFLVAGSLYLLPFGWHALAWGWMGLIWYNVIYTPLKKHTAFSVFPGAVVGAIPPMAGWIAAGGSLIDPRIHALAFFFFLGQMPHFWLLVLKYKKQYKKAGFPIITDVLNPTQVMRINRIWFLATITTALLLPMFGALTNRSTSLLLILSAISMMWWILKLSKNKTQLRQQFIYFNSFFLWVMLLIGVDQLL